MSLFRKIGSRCFCSGVVKPFDQMPGPRGFLGIGNIFNYSENGDYDFRKLDKTGFKKYAKYGPIVRERMLPGVDIVWLFDPKDIAAVMNEDPGQYPRRRSHFSVHKYRSDRPEIYASAGLLASNGEEWWNLRSKVQQPIAKPQNVRNFLPKADRTSRDFLESLATRFDDDQQIKDMLPELLRFSLEVICLMALDETVDAFGEKGREPDSLASKLIEAAGTINSLVLPLDHGIQLWKLYETPMYRKSREAQDFLGDAVVKMVAKRRENPGDGNSLLDQYLKNPKLTIEDIHTTAADLLLAGADTTAYASSYALYNVANHPEVQQLMFEEAVRVLPSASDELSASAINSEIPYTRAVLKESLRLHPIAVGVGRILNKDMVLGGYRVPKNTTIVTQNQISSRLENYFDDPNQFKPERWLKDENLKKPDINPYVSLPFGHGMRSCVARRFAEQNLLVLLLRIIRLYKLEWRGCSEPLEVVTILINEPASEISLKFIKR